MTDRRDYRFKNLIIRKCSRSAELVQQNFGDRSDDIIEIPAEQIPAVYKALSNIHAEEEGSVTYWLVALSE